MTSNANGLGHNGPLRFVIVGGGMAGILAAVKLQEAGFTDITIYEKAARLGGTWRENTYPGVACDVPSHLYSYSFAPNPQWSHVFSPGPEILTYLEQVARDFGVEKYVQYSTEVTRLVFEAGRWRITTSDGRQDAADVVVAATGVLHHPSYPAIDGIDRFAGPLFHTARWDRSVPLQGIRLGVIGTGSSAVQVTGDVVDTVGRYFLFQRTAQWILPMKNPPIEAEKQAAYRADPSLMAQLRAELGTMFEEGFANAVVDADSPQVRMLQQMCEANLDTVADPELRARLRPNYRAACKRLIISPNFYEAIQRPNAHLVTETIEQVEPEGVRTMDGVLHELDVLVLGTGFRVDRFLRPIEVVGPEGRTLDDVWDPRPWGYYSIAVPGFPNLFMLNGPNGPVGNFSLIDVAELQFGYILQLVEQLAAGRCRQISPRTGASVRFEEERTAAAGNTVWVTGCRSWYLDDRGLP
ncbi:MAG TPA: NAD(P)/FAD-dependent oxidoreductase, partial [Acidimicrobiales bacterium]|nr:NAD(P)/FAD-dependent oxidoreductase [Acidimicrobiales bacterium]